MAGDIPLWKSQRGMLMVIALVLYTVMLVANSYAPKPIDSTALGVIGTGVALGFVYFFKDKGEEALEKAKDALPKI